MSAVILKNGREKSLLRRHPWVFSQAIKHVDGKPQPGETIDVLAANGIFLGRGAYSPDSQIAVRIWTFDSSEQISSSFFHKRLKQAISCRSSSFSGRTAGYRLVNAESDMLPGLIVDRYGDFIVCQFLSRGSEFWKKEIISQLVELTAPNGIYERSDVDIRGKEGLPSTTGVLYGEEPPDRIEIEEGQCRFLVDVKHGHKTGFYLDQRDNRACVTEFAKDTELLNCFAYTGGFGVSALKGGASRVINVEASAEMLKLAEKNIEINGLDACKVENVEGDVFQVLRKYRDSRREFDLIILDPPKFVNSRNQLEQACRGYKDINLLAFKLLRPGGFLFTFSCSGLMPLELFQKIVADSALDAGREGRIIRRLSQAADHPTSLNFPEGSYLKGLVCMVN
ncbi:MAG: class I SAM-dependent methyltransferase [Kiritimatiellae bacterium]|nr:class I SAM-dependent methyltransferase [Kiritimatiellia bacterium]MDD5519350.1 class I SAM-dependent methyltransferase [Kiritimatiellia bacterium]